MARAGSSIGFWGIFGRSGDLRQLDKALRDADLHPALVPEGVKLTTVNLMKDVYGNDPPAQAYAPVADLLAYCVLGANGFAGANGTQRLDEVETRLRRALDDGEGLYAGIVLLAVHAKLINPGVVEAFGIEVDEQHS